MSRANLSSGTPVFRADPDVAVERGVVILPDIGGLSPNLERIASDVAESCAAAVAVVELFPGNEHLTFPERLEFGLRDISEPRALADAVEAAALLRVEPVAVMGFCIGGALAMRAVHVGRFDQVVAWYGMVHLPPPWAGDKGNPLDAVRRAEVPVLQVAGDADEFISGADLDELEAAGATVWRVAGAKHAFAHDPAHPNHDAAAAATMWNAVAGVLSVAGSA